MNITNEEFAQLEHLLQKARYVVDLGWWFDKGTDFTGKQTHVRIVFSSTDETGNLHGENDAWELCHLLLKACGFSNALEKAKTFDKDVRENDGEGVNILSCIPHEFRERAQQILSTEGGRA